MASETDGTLVVVGFDDEVTESCLGPTGALAGAKPGHVIFICSTVRPSVSLAVGQRSAPLGVSVMDATLCRSEHAAISGELLVLLGGDGDTFEPWKHAFEAFATDVVLVGPLGTGQVAKTLNNVLLWSAVVANAEILRLGMRHGIDQEKLREALLLSSGANWALETWPRARPMPWAEKDMEIALELAAEVGLEAPLSTSVEGLIAAIKRSKSDAPGGIDMTNSSMQVFLEEIELKGDPTG
jgi:3-hydroxyisobutyrate dehydrogenase-like beta-hydroxyacid dehydrogenase